MKKIIIFAAMALTLAANSFASTDATQSATELVVTETALSQPLADQLQSRPKTQSECCNTVTVQDYMRTETRIDKMQRSFVYPVAWLVNTAVLPFEVIAIPDRTLSVWQPENIALKAVKAPFSLIFGVLALPMDGLDYLVEHY